MDGLEIRLETIQWMHSAICDGIKAMLLIKGRMDVESGGRVSHLSADDVIVIGHNQLHAIRGDGMNLVLILELGGDFLRRDGGELFGCALRCDSSLGETAKAAEYFELKRHLMQMLILYVDKRDGYQLELKTLLYSLMACMFRFFRAEKSVSDEKDNAREAVMRAVEYINAHYQTDLSLASVAKLAYMSPQYFSKLFKRIAGIGFLEYLTDVRLRHALVDLTATDDSILKIAISHGFSNAKSFSRVLKNKCGMLPSVYRTQHASSAQAAIGGDAIRAFNLDQMDADLDFLRYLRDDNAQRQQRGDTVQAISLCAPGKRPFPKPAKILLMDSLSSMLHAETLGQLQLVQKKLGFQYAHFQRCIDTFAYWFDDWQTFGYYKMAAVFGSLYELQLVPIFHVECALVHEIYAGRDGMRGFVACVRQILERCFADPFLKRLMQQCKFELAGKDDERILLYGTLVKELGGYLDQENFGIQAPMDREDGAIPLEQTLTRLSSARLSPGFISFCAYPELNPRTVSIKAYYQQKLEEIRIAMNACGCHADVYMLRWNTLVGKSSAEVTTFFRSALILDAVLRVCGGVAGIGFYLDTAGTLNAPYRAENVNMALFLHYKIKRPAFFVVEALNALGEELLHQGDNLYVTANEQNEIILAAYYPCYVNPAFSLDYTYVRETTLQRSLRLTGLEPGRYRIKTYLYDRAGTSVLSMVENIGGPGFLDADVMEYLEGAAAPRIQITEEDISDEYAAEMNLPFNAICVVRIRKVG